MQNRQKNTSLVTQAADTVMTEQANASATEIFVIEPAKSPVRRVWKILRAFLILLGLVLFLSVIIVHYSRFSFQRGFVLLVKDGGFVSVDEREIEFRQLLVRHRLPFALSVTTRLCRIDESGTDESGTDESGTGGNERSPQWTVMETRTDHFSGIRSWYSGTYELRLCLLTSDDGRYLVTDRRGLPQKLLKTRATDADATEHVLLPANPGLPSSLGQSVRDGKIGGISGVWEEKRIGGRAQSWCYALPGEQRNMVLIIAVTAQIAKKQQ